MVANRLQSPLQSEFSRNRTTSPSEVSDPSEPLGRRQITAALVEEADRMLVVGCDAATIAARLGITEYLAGVVAGDTERAGKRQPPQRPMSRQVVNPQRGVDATTIRMIRRMLEVGILPPVAIAREAGVSITLVEQVARGERLPVNTKRYYAFEDLGERLLAEPARCLGCGAMIAIAPCRACRQRKSMQEPIPFSHN